MRVAACHCICALVDFVSCEEKTAYRTALVECCNGKKSNISLYRDVVYDSGKYSFLPTSFSRETHFPILHTNFATAVQRRTAQTTTRKHSCAYHIDRYSEPEHWAFCD